VATFSTRGDQAVTLTGAQFGAAGMEAINGLVVRQRRVMCVL
jgi:hypothetical protein